MILNLKPTHGENKLQQTKIEDKGKKHVDKQIKLTILYKKPNQHGHEMDPKLATATIVPRENSNPILYAF